MTTATTNNLIISIPTGSANEERDALIKAIASAMRWRANCGEHHRDDDESIATISSLLTELSMLE
jgi:hypothetical protein